MPTSRHLSVRVDFALGSANDAAVFVYHAQMLSDIPLTLSRGHITIQRC